MDTLMGNSYAFHAPVVASVRILQLESNRSFTGVSIKC